jgi:CelD/BcsL family acetyltransferase involved in cellulose biosynthesis
VTPPAAAADLALQRVDDPAEVRDAWDRLAQRSDNVFATPEWLLAWWRSCGAGELHLWRWGDAAAPRALFPLHLHDGTLRFLGHPAGDQLGPVCAPEDRPGAARALRALLESGQIAWLTFRGDELPCEVAWDELLGAQVVKRQPAPLLRLPAGATWEEFLAARSRNFRVKARQKERQLARAGRLVYRCTTDAEELEADFATFVELHNARWGGPTKSFAGLEGFHLDFTARALARGWLRLRFLELDGRPLVALYNLRFGASEGCYQTGRTPEERRSVGFVLHAHAIRECLADGLREYRLLRGGEPYKARFANATADLVSVAREA